MMPAMPMRQANLPAWIESGAEVCADRPLLDHRQFRRQRARAQQKGQVACGGDGEIAANDAATAQDRILDDRRGDDLVVEHDGKAPADVLGGRVAEFSRAERVELEGDDRQAALVETLLRIDQVFAGDQRSLFDAQQLAGILLRHVHHGPRNGAHAARPLHHVEGEFCVCAEVFLQLLDVRDARHLQDDAIFALPDNGWFERPDSSMRRRITSIDCSTVRALSCARPASL